MKWEQIIVTHNLYQINAIRQVLVTDRVAHRYVPRRVRRVVGLHRKRVCGRRRAGLRRARRSRRHYPCWGARPQPPPFGLALPLEPLDPLDRDPVAREVELPDEPAEPDPTTARDEPDGRATLEVGVRV